ncbi:hypothetical protein AK830_g8678 [Neonectria ditissima]|uniref:Uncharacterized protein n=1 Tax=Neonectria ditissima TaxID=78410 RepID=A0A0P7B7I2_9HYPO|nr:hypothetical protein AK830_g8678 [Neonectria ditissima]
MLQYYQVVITSWGASPGKDVAARSCFSIKVRAKARHLSAAICDASQKLFQRTRPQGDITLRVKASTSVELEKTQDKMAEVVLKPPRESMQTRWSIDTAQLEAILGLWLWSLYSDERHEIKDESGNKISMAEQVKTARIISAGIDGLDRCKEANRQGEMSLWLGTNVVMLSEATINIDKYEGHGLLDLWESAATGDDWKRVSEKQQWDQTKAHRLPSETRRFCGWNVVHRSTQHWASGSSNQDATQRSKLRLQYSLTDGPLLEICAQELFTALIMSLTALLSIGAVDVVEVDGHVRLDNPTVTVLATAFTNSGLGSYSDAISCIVPAFADRLRPDPETVLSALIRAADTYRREAEWGRAEIMMRWACQHHFLPFSEEQEPTSSHIVVASMQRSCVRLESSIAGHLHNIPTTRDRYLQTPELREIISSYQEIAKRFAKPSSSPVDHDRPVRHQKLAEAIRARDRTEALYILCFITAEELGSEQLQSALPLSVRNDWSEVKTPFLWAVQAGQANVAKRLLGTGQVDPDRADCEGHTPLSWAVYHGHEALVEMLLFANGVDLDRRDVRGQTVLFQAVKETKEAIVQVLLDSGKFDVNAKDDPGNGLTALHWAARNGNETIVQLLLNTQTINVNEKDTFNQTALHRAAREGNESIFQMLLDDGRTRISKEDGWQFLFDPTDWAKPMNEGIIRRLLNSGRLDPDVEDDIGRAALFKATQDGHQAIVQMVLDSGKIEINGERRVGEHALSAAAKIGNMAIVKMLLGKIQRG